MRTHHQILWILLFLGAVGFSQEISQFNVFAGRFDYFAIGNTLNIAENGPEGPCELLSQSSATLSLEEDQTVIAAYLYWAGSGTGDFEVVLNDVPITAERTFADAIDDNRPFFAGFTDVTEQVLATGNGEYTFGGIDILDILPNYCPSGTNFAGWSIILVYEDMDLPLNQVNVFDGLESVSQFNNELSISLTNLNVLDNVDAKIGFLAWEGDAGLAVDETLSINGNLLSNAPLNPVNNQFNSTNTFTESDSLYNMDIDVYSIENNIAIGDDTAVIVLTSGQDFVMINTIITVLNSQLPDALIAIDNVDTVCNSREVTVSYTVTNQGTEVLPINTPIAFYGDGILTGTDTTSQAIEMGNSESFTTILTIVDGISEFFTLQAVVDDPAIVTESNEDNNESNEVTLNLTGIDILDISLLQLCDDSGNDGLEVFNLDAIAQEAVMGQNDIAYAFYVTLNDATAQINPITEPEAYENISNPQTVYIRFFLETDTECFTIVPLEMEVSFQPSVPLLEPLEICDDSLNNDGIASFNLTLQESFIIEGQQDVVIRYYESLENANQDINAISTPENYTNSTASQMIYVRVETSTNPLCFDLGFFELQVNPIPELVLLQPLLECNEGFEVGTFDLFEASELANIPEVNVTGFYTTLEDAETLNNAITIPVAYQNTTNPQAVYLRIEGDDITDCYQIAQVTLMTENCPPFVPEGFSPNGDGINDTFEISGLKDIFENYQLFIYSRLGNLIYQGDNGIDFWDGVPNKGISGTLAPTGVYYWVLQLNDTENSDRAGWVYLNR